MLTQILEQNMVDIDFSWTLRYALRQKLALNKSLDWQTNIKNWQEELNSKG